MEVRTARAEGQGERAGRSRSGHLAIYGGAVRSHSGTRRRREGQQAAHAPRRPGEVVPHSGNHPGSRPELTHSAGLRPQADMR